MKKTDKIYVAGHTGLVGSALVRALQAREYNYIITRTFEELDLRDQQATEKFFAQEKPDYVFLAAAKVGGIQANINYPAAFIYDNLMITTNVVHAAYKYSVKKLLFFGSSCIYPRLAAQPITEDALLTGPLEPTNEPYAIAKIAGLKLCQAYNKQYNTNFISCMPTNLYGPGDTFDPINSHVIPALINKIYTAHINNSSQVIIWGTGTARREFLYVDDLADAALFLMNNYTGSSFINIGVGVDSTIYELAHCIKNIIGFTGALVFDITKPDGMPQKLLDISKLRELGWQAQTQLEKGLEKTIAWFIQQYNNR